jgi:hypothetical protein
MRLQARPRGAAECDDAAASCTARGAERRREACRYKRSLARALFALDAAQRNGATHDVTAAAQRM